MDLWLERVVRRTGVHYAVFFGLMGFFLYLLGLLFALITENIDPFLSEPRWVLVVVFGSLNGILIVFTYRKFEESLEGIRSVIAGVEEYGKVRNRVLGWLTKRYYWVIVAFWLTLNFTHAPMSMAWWGGYNQPYVVTVYNLIATFPCCLLGGIFMYMIPIGLTLAYRELCTEVDYRRESFMALWMKPFMGFRTLITLTMLGAVVYSVFPSNIWGTAPGLAEERWIIYVPYTSIAIVLGSVAIFPHHYFHRLFTGMRSNRLEELEGEISQSSTGDTEGMIKRILTLLEKGEVERLGTWLIDLKVVAELLLVVLMHVTLVEALTILLHG